MNYEEEYKKLFKEYSKLKVKLNHTVKSFSQMFEMQCKEIEYLNRRYKLSRFFFYLESLTVIALCSIYLIWR